MGNALLVNRGPAPNMLHPSECDLLLAAWLEAYQIGKAPTEDYPWALIVRSLMVGSAPCHLTSFIARMR
jgi:hypothetical protein